MATIRGKKQARNIKSQTRRIRARRVRIGAPDGRLTPAAGVEAEFFKSSETSAG